MANYEYINDTGVVIPDTSVLRTQVETEFKNAFGNDLITDGFTPQGVLINGETFARDTLVRNNAVLANQINPNTAGGIFLDAIGALTGTERDDEKFSTVLMDYAGAPFAAFTPAVIFEDAGGNEFSPAANVTLNSAGTATGIAIARKAGPINVNANTVTIIKNGAIGLETVSNSAPSTLGSLTQSDEQFRVKRRQIIGKLGTGNILQVISSVRSLLNVTSAELVENYNSDIEIIDGITMQPHSIYLCVDGGAAIDIAATMATKKGPGCGFTNGASSVPVSVLYTNPYTGQVYTVLFDRPDLIPILVRVTVSLGSFAINAVDIIKNAILDYANGSLGGESGLKIGVAVTPFELAGAINIRAQGVFVRNVEIAKVSAPIYSNAPIPIEKFERATISESSIIVNIV